MSDAASHYTKPEGVEEFVDETGVDRLAMTTLIRQIFAENPAEFDRRLFPGPALDELIQMVKLKNEQVLGI